MAVYINRERKLNEATEVRRRALAKAERYDDLRRRFKEWAGTAVNAETGIKFTEAEVNADLQRLDDLVDFWRRRAEVGEQDSDAPV